MNFKINFKAIYEFYLQPNNEDTYKLRFRQHHDGRLRHSLYRRGLYTVKVNMDAMKS